MDKGLTLHWLDYLIIIFSLVISVWMGIRFSKNQNSTGNYFKGTGKIPAWAIGMSILATLISSVTFLAYPGEGFSSNWILLVQGLMVPLALIFVVSVIVPLYRKAIKLSAYEYFEMRFGFFARLYASIGFSFVHFTKMGTVFYLLGIAISGLTGINSMYIILIIGVLVILVTMLGGIEAVIWLDVIQGFMLIAGGVISLLIILFSVDGGPVEIWNVASENGKTGFGPFDFEFVNLTFWVMVLNGIFYAIQKYGTDQTIVQRYLTAKSDKQAIKASLIGVLLSVPVWALFMFIGTALFSYYKISGNILPSGIDPDQVFPYFILSNLPVGIVGFIISALIAASFSTLDSDLNCLSAICIEDYYLRFYPNTSEKKKMILSRLIIVLTGAGAMLIAFIYILSGGEGILGTVFNLYAIFSGGIAGMFLLGIFSRKANKKGVYIGIFACVIFTLWAMLTTTSLTINGTKQLILDLDAYNFPHHKMMIGVYSHLVLIIVGYFASFAFKDKPVNSMLTYSGWKEFNRKQKKLNQPQI